MRVVVLLIVAACGRIDFDPHARSDAMPGDFGVDGAPCTHTFCDDFDRSSAPGEPWDNADATDGGGFSLVDGKLVLSLPTSDSSGFVEKSFTFTTQLTIRFQITLETADAGAAELDLEQTQWPAGSGGCDVLGHYFVRDATVQTNFQETYSMNCGSNRNHYSPDIVDGLPHDITMNLRTALIGLEVDGAPVYEQPPVHSPPAAQVLVRLGGGGRDFNAAWTLRYDNVQIDSQ